MLTLGPLGHTLYSLLKFGEQRLIQYKSSLRWLYVIHWSAGSSTSTTSTTSTSNNTLPANLFATHLRAFEILMDHYQQLLHVPLEALRGGSSINLSADSIRAGIIRVEKFDQEIHHSFIQLEKFAWMLRITLEMDSEDDGEGGGGKGFGEGLEGVDGHAQFTNEESSSSSRAAQALDAMLEEILGTMRTGEDELRNELNGDGADSRALQSEQKISEEQRRGDVCKRGHPLTQFRTTHPNFHCDECTMRQSTSSSMYGCRTCNYDMCEQCHDSSGAAAAAARLRKETSGDDDDTTRRLMKETKAAKAALREAKILSWERWQDMFMATKEDATSRVGKKEEEEEEKQEEEGEEEEKKQEELEKNEKVVEHKEGISTTDLTTDSMTTWTCVLCNQTSSTTGAAWCTMCGTRRYQKTMLTTIQNKLTLARKFWSFDFACRPKSTSNNGKKTSNEKMKSKFNNFFIRGFISRKEDWHCIQCKALNKRYRKRCHTCSTSRTSKRVASSPRRSLLRSSPLRLPRVAWGCSACTYLNTPVATRCDMCRTRRPEADPEEQQVVVEAAAGKASGIHVCRVGHNGRAVTGPERQCAVGHNFDRGGHGGLCFRAQSVACFS